MMRLWSTIRKIKENCSVGDWRCVLKFIRWHSTREILKAFGGWGLWVDRVRCSSRAEPCTNGICALCGPERAWGRNERVAVCDLEACSHQNLTGQNLISQLPARATQYKSLLFVNHPVSSALLQQPAPTKTTSQRITVFENHTSDKSLEFSLWRNLTKQ